jgi:hypothetical protein
VLLFVCEQKHQKVFLEGEALQTIHRSLRLLKKRSMKNITRLLGFGYLAIALLATLASNTIGPLGYAPFPISIGPAPEPVVVTIWYGTEKRAWLEEAARRFAATSPRQGRRPITIVLRGLGSREIPLRVAQQAWQADGQPTVISPASSIWVELLRSEWATRGNSGQIIADGPAPPLALTPLVLVGWEERTRLLWADERGDLWAVLHDALADPRGWIGIAEARGFAAGTPENTRASQWGPVKFGHTSPLGSNSGAQALMLMAYAYHQKTSGLTVADIGDAGFQQWFSDVERSIPVFGDSSGGFMQEMVLRGPSQYDLVATYENLAIENIDNARSRWGNLRVYYPPATMFSDHPYATLEAPWVTPEQRAAATQFGEFLRSRPMQELALQYGFRPADPNVPIQTAGPNNPFTKYQASGVRVDIAQQVQTPSGEVVAALVELWRRTTGR